MQDAVERWAAFYVEREMHKQGERYDPWYRFHYPVDYYYDDLPRRSRFMTALGYGDGPGLRLVISLLKRKGHLTDDGSWMRSTPTWKAGYRTGMRSIRRRDPLPSPSRGRERRAR